ncbi:MAG: hypothetical protein AB8G05_17600 [Oligoflexales bacterium]
MKHLLRSILIFLICTQAQAMQNANRVARLYCEYMNAPTSFVKLKQKDNVSYKVAAKYEPSSNTYYIDTMDYYHALSACHKQNIDGNLLGIRANNGKSRETTQLLFNKRAKVAAIGFDGNVKIIDVNTFSKQDSSKTIQKKIKSLELLEINNIVNLLQGLEDENGAITSLVENLDQSTINKIRDSLGLNSLDEISSTYGSTAFIVTATIASIWFQGPLVCGLTEALYPHVYAMIYGSVPSTYSFSYWAIYYPSMKHTSNFAFNNAHFIVPFILKGGSVTGRFFLDKAENIVDMSKNNSSYYSLETPSIEAQ